MKNLIRICLVLMFFCAFSSESKAQNTIPEGKRKLIAEIVVLTKADQQFFEITDKMIQSLNTMMPAMVLQSFENNEKLSDAEKKRLTAMMEMRFQSFSRKFSERLPQAIGSKKYIEEIFYPIYDKFFTEKELSDLAAFYKSETGQKFVSIMPQFVEETNKLTEKHLLPQVMKLAEELIKEEFPEVNNQKSGTPPPPAPPPGKNPNK